MVVFHVVIFLFFKFASLLRDGFGVKGLEPKTVYSIRTLETARFDADTKSRIKFKNLIKEGVLLKRALKKKLVGYEGPKFHEQQSGEEGK